jgi:hypothetical protein
LINNLKTLTTKTTLVPQLKYILKEEGEKLL